MAKLVFAKHRSAIVHVAHVASGLACDCVCIDCGERLIAKKGEIRDHHFAHASGTEHDWAWETHLHAYAKQLILQEGALSVPLHAGISEVLGLATDRDRGRLQAGDIRIQAEVSLGAVRPDLLLQMPDRQVTIAFEVRVTHACDAQKVAEFKRQRVPVLEIDLRKFPSTNFNASLLRDVVLHQVESKEWLWPLPPVTENTDAEVDSDDLRAWPPPPLAGHTPRRRSEAPERTGAPPELPPESELQFHVPAWKAVVRVRIEPRRGRGPNGEGEGVDVIVQGMTGGIPAGQPEMATPRITHLVEQIFDSHAPWAERTSAHAWYVQAWDAPAIADALKQAARDFHERDRQERYRNQQVLSEDLRQARERAIQYSASDRRPAPTPAPRDNPYARRKG